MMQRDSRKQLKVNDSQTAKVTLPNLSTQPRGINIYCAYLIQNTIVN